VPLEALLCGTPVIVCDDSGCGEIISRVGGGLVVRHGDVAALAAAMDAILRHQNEWRVRARTAADAVRRLYRSDVVCARLVELYEGRLKAAATVVGRGLTPALPVSFVIPVLNGHRVLRSCIE